jgi:exosortase
MRLLGPLLYLFFLVPSGEFLVPKLQEFTASLAIGGLQIVGVPVYSDGIFIQIPEGAFVVAEACAGLRFLVASIAYGAIFLRFSSIPRGGAGSFSSAYLSLFRSSPTVSELSVLFSPPIWSEVPRR